MAIDGELLGLAESLGTSLGEASRMPWGDANATWRLHLTDGRDVMARKFAPGLAGQAERVAASMTAAAAAGIQVPSSSLIEIEGTPWLLTDHVEGRVGADWLDTGARARLLAAAMGSLRPRLLEIDRSAAHEAMTPREYDLPRVGAAAREALKVAESTLSERRVEPAFVHGDYAPINVIVDGDGGIRALLDFERAHVGDPLEDAAWWSWVVRHHHPAAWGAAWPTFCEAARVDPVEDGPTIQALIVRALARRASATRDVQGRDRWLGRLSEAAAWRS